MARLDRVNHATEASTERFDHSPRLSMAMVDWLRALSARGETLHRSRAGADAFITDFEPAEESP